MRKSIVLGQVVPVPVGHRVEVLPLGDDTAYVRDLDTGVEFVPFWLVSREPSCSYFTPGLYAEPIDPARLDRRRALNGQVTACRVVTMAISSCDPGFATRLELEVAG